MNRKNTSRVNENLKNEIFEHSERKDKTMVKDCDRSIKAAKCIDLSKWKQEVFSLEPKHPDWDKFNNFFSIVDVFCPNLKNYNVPGESFDENEVAA